MLNIIICIQIYIIRTVHTFGYTVFFILEKKERYEI